MLRSLLSLLVFVIQWASFIAMGHDKWKAARGYWRTSERTLLLLGAAAPFGFLAAMVTFAHKTRKPAFIGMGLLSAVVQLWLAPGLLVDSMTAAFRFTFFAPPGVVLGAVMGTGLFAAAVREGLRMYRDAQWE